MMFKLTVFKVFLILALLPTIFGVVYLSLFEGKMSFGIEQQISQEIKNTVLISYIFSWSLIILFLSFSKSLVRYQYELRYSNSHINDLKNYKILVVFLFFSVIIFELIRLPSIPLLVLITDGISAGSIARGEVIEFQIENSIPILGYFLVFFPSFAIIWLYYLKLVDQISKPFFWALAIIYLSYYILFLGKGFFITPLLLCFLIKSIVFNKSISFSAPFILIAITLPLFLSVTENSIIDAANVFVNRAFVGQSEGMYWIREIYSEPSVKATIYGFPIGYLFGIVGFDPSIEVIKILFGDVDGWVNANSFFIGQGWVMLGDAVILIGPLLIIANIALIKLSFPLFRYSRESRFLHIIAFYVIITLPVNTNFALILYLKPFLSFFINATISEWLIFRPYKIIKRNNFVPI